MALKNTGLESVKADRNSLGAIHEKTPSSRGKLGV
jgi:hypothetical protein